MYLKHQETDRLKVHIIVFTYQFQPPTPSVLHSLPPWHPKIHMTLLISVRRLEHMLILDEVDFKDSYRAKTGNFLQQYKGQYMSNNVFK